MTAVLQSIREGPVAEENSFDIVSSIDLAEVDNAINQTRK